MASDNVIIHKNPGTNKNGNNDTMHKNAVAKQNTGNPTMHKNTGIKQNTGNPTMHKNAVTKQNSGNPTMHKNAVAKQNTGNPTMHKNAVAKQNTGNPTMHKNTGTKQNSGNPTMHKNAGIKQNANNPTMNKNAVAKQNANNPTMHNNSGNQNAQKRRSVQVTDDMKREFATTKEALEKYEEYLDEFEKNRTVWLEEEWSDEVFSRGSLFHGYTITGKLVNRNDITIPVGTESIGIYKGTDGEKEVLIKILNTVDPELERLVNETLIPISKRTPAIVTYYEAGHQKFKTDDGFERESTYEIMEFCGTKSLEELICGDKRRFDSDYLDKFIRDMVEGLEVMQENKIFHSDLKPSNIIYNEAENQFIIIDFGTARNWEEHSREVLLGKGWTEAFKAPELSDPNATPNRADFYSLGQIIFYLSTGGYLSSWVLPDDAKSEVSGNRRISLTEFTETQQGGEWFSKPLARLYDGLSRRDTTRRYVCKDIRDWLEKIGVEFAGQIYHPNDRELYEAMGNNWEQAKKFLFESQEFKDNFEMLSRDNEKLNALQTAQMGLRENPQSADELLGKFLLEAQGSMPVMIYKGETYANIEEFAEKYLTRLREHNAAKEQELVRNGMLDIFYEKCGKEKSKLQSDFITYNNRKKDISEEEAYAFCYNVLRKTVFVYQGIEYTSKEELFQVAKKKIKVSYEEYINFCQELNRSSEFKAWSNIVGGRS